MCVCKTLLWSGRDDGTASTSGLIFGPLFYLIMVWISPFNPLHSRFILPLFLGSFLTDRRRRASAEDKRDWIDRHSTTGEPISQKRNRNKQNAVELGEDVVWRQNAAKTSRRLKDNLSSDFPGVRSQRKSQGTGASLPDTAEKPGLLQGAVQRERYPGTPPTPSPSPSPTPHPPPSPSPLSHGLALGLLIYVLSYEKVGDDAS